MAAIGISSKAAMKKPMNKPAMFFGGHGHGFPKPLRVVAAATATAMAWLAGPVNAFAKKPTPIKPYSRLSEKGLTQTPNAALRAKITAKETAAGVGKKNADKAATPEVRPLSKGEMEALRGSGPYRNAYFNGTMPWQRSLRDVNLCNGNLFKSFTDIQIAPGRGAGLVLQRTYNSNDERVGPFGVGWTHAYDIRMEEAGTSPAEVEPGTDPAADVEVVPRTDFFGGKHDYKRDADGLYSPPAYMFDELDSKYDNALANGPSEPNEDTQKGMDGTTKHFVTNETLPIPPQLPGAAPFDPINHKVRVCDWIEDRHGNRTTLTYGNPVTMADGSTKTLLQSVTDPVGRSLTFIWANLGTTSQPAYRITEVDGPSGTYSVTYAYNSDLNLSSVTLDSGGLARTTTYGYTTCQGESGLLASITDPLGHAVSYTYDLPSNCPTGSIWVTQVAEPSGDDENGTARSTPLKWYIKPVNSYGYFRVQFYNRDLVSDPDADFTIYDFPEVQVDYQLRMMNMKASTGGFTTFVAQYDSANNVTQTLTRDGAWVGYTNGVGAYQNQVDTTYGPHGNVLTQSVYGYPGVTTTHYYNASKYFQKASVTDALGHVSTFDYYDDQDANVGNRGEVKWVRDARYNTTGKQFEYAYNQYGQKISEKNLNDVVTAYTYGDSWGDLTKVVQDPDDIATNYVGLHRTTQMSYDVFGRVLSSIDPNGKTSTFSYNKLGQPTTANFAATASTPSETILYSYGANGRTNTVTDGRGVTGISYETGCDRVASVTDPVTGTLNYSYTDDGRRTRVGMPNGESVHYTYDVDNNTNPIWLLSKDDPNSLTFRLLKIEDGDGRRVDVLYKDIQLDNVQNQVGSNANANWIGRIAGLRYNQTFTNAGGAQPVSFCESTNLYDRSLATSNPRFTRSTLIRQQTLFWNNTNNNGWQSSLKYRNEYGYNDNAQRTSNTITTTNASGNLQSRTETYGYDELSRLTGVNYGDAGTANVQSYAFDAMGNRTAKTDNVTGTYNYGYDAANRLLYRSRGHSGYAYGNDANGNSLGNVGGTNTWDSQNRLVKVVKGGVTSDFTYGCDGLRRRSIVTKANGEQTKTDYVLDGQNVVQEVVRQRASSSATWGTASTVSYLQGPSGPMYRHVSGTTDVAWYVYDGLGSVVGEVDVTGNLTSTKDHDVYGLTRSVTGNPTSRHGFVGQLGHTEDDETGYIYMRARHYDPETGRFASQDIAADGINWFVYVNNDPVNSFDRTGNNAEQGYAAAFVAACCAGAAADAFATGKIGWAIFCIGLAAAAALNSAFHFFEALGGLKLSGAELNEARAAGGLLGAIAGVAGKEGLASWLGSMAAGKSFADKFACGVLGVVVGLIVGNTINYSVAIYMVDH